MRNEYTDCVYKNGNLFYFLDGTCIPVKEKIHEGIMELMTSPKGLKIINQGTIAYTDLYKDILVGVKQSADSVVLLDTNRGEVSVHALCPGMDRWGNYALVFMENALIYCFMKNNGQVAEFNCETKNVDVNMFTRNKGLVYSCGVKHGEYVYLIPKMNNQMIVYSLSEKTIKEIYCEKCFESPVDASFCGNDLLILESDGQLIRMSKDGVVKNIARIRNENIKVCRFCIVDKGKYAIIFPGTSSAIFIMNLDTDECKKYDNYPDDFTYRDGYSGIKYYGYSESDTYYYFANRAANYAALVNKDSGAIEWHRQPEIPQEVMLAYDLLSNSYLNEDNIYKLEVYIKMLSK